REIYEDREVTRLGESVFQSGFLSPKAMADTVKVLRRFHRIAQKHGTDVVRVVATSALRDARNSQAFIEWVHSATGWRVETISGIEEARLIHLGLVANLRINAWPALMIDLGGGSCELTISDQGHIREVVSLPLGAVRLTNEFLRHDPPRKSELESMRKFINREIRRVAPRVHRAAPKVVIATSGTGAALAAMSQSLHGSSGRNQKGLSRANLARLVKVLSRRNLQERRKLPGLGPKRAEIIVAGAVVFSELIQHCNLRGFRYSDLGLRDGLLVQMAAERDRSTRRGKQLESDRWDSLLAAGKHYHVDMAHARRMREISMQLFAALRSVHALPPEYKEWLSSAAMLYEVGAFINRFGRHRHAYYIIANSEMLGFTPQERRIIAAIARYVGKSRPLPGDAAMKTIPIEEHPYVIRAALLLRLARALNLGRGGAVARVRARIRDAEVVLSLIRRGRASVDLELWAVERERGYFREVFGRELSVALA
ncbi:MAG TPA: Ppx/GppA phosphatase family protein, partial [Terriglobales bacterium]|nr:Ppx/GppA phosphatase family protein [Terriglobales bacterium]